MFGINFIESERAKGVYYLHRISPALRDFDKHREIPNVPALHPAAFAIKNLNTKTAYAQERIGLQSGPVVTVLFRPSGWLIRSGVTDKKLSTHRSRSEFLMRLDVSTFLSNIGGAN